MKALYFEHEHKKKKANLVIFIVAFITLICIGIGCSYAMKQSGSDPVRQTFACRSQIVRVPAC